MKIFAGLLTFASLACLGAATFQPVGIPFKYPVTVAPGFAAKVVFSNLTDPRGIAFDSQQNLLVVEHGVGVTAFTQVNSLGAGWERTVVVKNPNLTQGIQVDQYNLYLSTADSVLVYKYDPVTKTVDPAPFYPYVAISGLPADGEFDVHILQLETNASGETTGILVGSGPLTNIDLTARDPASGRSQIRRFVPSSSLPIFPPPATPWSKGQVIAYGIRNPIGFAFGPNPLASPIASNSLYVTENGASIGNSLGFTPTFSNDNPADEVVLVNYPTSNTFKPRFYGFPDCSSLWNPTADPTGEPQYVNLQRGDQFSLNLDPARDDSWCRNTTNNQGPIFTFQAHSAPVDIKFYTPQPAATTASFPSSFSGHAFVSLYGSFNRSPPTGYGVVRVPFPLGTADDTLGYSFLVQAKLLNTCPDNCIHPVGLAFGKDGRLYVSSDATGEVFLIERSFLTPL